MRIVIPGIAGRLGRMLAERLLAAGHEVTGIDKRPWRDAPEGVEVHEVDIRKRAAEDVFRRHRPEGVIHMATVTHLTAQTEDRFRINLGGTRAVFDHCHQWGAQAAVFVGRHTYYGASAETPLYHKEDDPPMAVTTFPELADLVAADLYAGSALWRFPDLRTAVLRIPYTLGPARVGTLATFLRGPRVPVVLGFDPLFQFMHERDVADAIVVGLEKQLRGVYNVAGPAPVPLSLLIKLAGRTPVPVPEPVLRLVLGRFGLPSLPPGALTHVKYPVVIDDAVFRKATGWTHRFDEDATIESFRGGRGGHGRGDDR